jgi:hypothetical protein
MNGGALWRSGPADVEPRQTLSSAGRTGGDGERQR